MILSTGPAFLAAWMSLSAWPGAMLIRVLFNLGSKKISVALEPHLPDQQITGVGRSFGPGRDDHLDLFYPESPGRATGEMPVVVWVHGGGWVSGHRGDIANFLRILAARGVVAVGVEYSTAPEARYPRPVEQVNAALGFLARESDELQIDAGRIVLAGDSAGAQIAAQVALLNTDPDYARMLGISPSADAGQIRAALLCCGAYELELAGDTRLQKWFMNTVLRAYSGRRDFRESQRFALASVFDRVGGSFPPTFITAGNADPLLQHSEAMARRLEAHEVPVAGLFFPPELTPGLGHEYQFDLDRPEGRQALDRMVRFIERYT